MRSRRTGTVVVTVLSLAIVLTSARYLQFDPSSYFPEQREVYVDREAVLGLHIIGALIALATGPFQFVTRIRRHVRVHRALGTLYVVGVLTGGIGGLLLSTTAHGGAVAGFGFAALALFWLTCTALGLRMVLTGRVGEHRRWMIRGFALTFAAVTLRLMLAVVKVAEAAGFPIDFTTSYVAIAWLCWVPNLALAWWFTRRGRVGQATRVSTRSDPVADASTNSPESSAAR